MLLSVLDCSVDPDATLQIVVVDASKFRVSVAHLFLVVVAGNISRDAGAVLRAGGVAVPALKEGLLAGTSSREKAVVVRAEGGGVGDPLRHQSAQGQNEEHGSVGERAGFKVDKLAELETRKDD